VLDSLTTAREATRRVFLGRVMKMVDLSRRESGNREGESSDAAVSVASSAFSTSTSAPCARELTELDSEGKEVATHSTAEGTKRYQCRTRD